ncbi:hypothetical protein MXB_3406 [Myxobolus squamalis]|nr:hypothetical protein MXB_3406 [Myxobolus squamalis]
MLRIYLYLIEKLRAKKGCYDFLVFVHMLNFLYDQISIMNTCLFRMQGHHKKEARDVFIDVIYEEFFQLPHVICRADVFLVTFVTTLVRILNSTNDESWFHLCGDMRLIYNMAYLILHRIKHENIDLEIDIKKFYKKILEKYIDIITLTMRFSYKNINIQIYSSLILQRNSKGII